MVNAKPITCVGLGEILWDILPDGPRVGGAPGNFTFHAMQMGLDASAVSSLGKDERGDEALRILQENGLKVHAYRSDKETGYVKATLDERGVPTYNFALDTAYDNMPFTKEFEDIAKKTQVCCFGTLAQRQENGESRKSILAFLDAMPKDSLKVFDINLRQNFYNAEVIKAGLERCTAFKCNDDELPIVCKLLGIEVLSPEDFYNQVLKGKFDIDQFIYTCGEHGSDIFYFGQHSYVPTPKVNVVDTVGAGDSFTATFIGLTVQGVDFKVAHQAAADVAAYVCTQSGAMPLLSAELKSRVQDLIAKAQA